MARPSNYKPTYAEKAKELCLAGATDVDLADYFAVSITTITNWKSRYPEFLAALKASKDVADDRVERSLYQRALGYTFDAVKIFPPRVVKDGEDWVAAEPVVVPYREHVPPDVTACIFWLKNRRKEAWRDRHELEHHIPAEFERLSDRDLLEQLSRQANEMGVNVTLTYDFGQGDENEPPKLIEGVAGVETT